MNFNKSMIIMNAIKDFQEAMNKKSETDWVMDIGDNCCLFSIYFLDTSNRVEVDGKIGSIFRTLEKDFDIKSEIIGKTITCYLEVKKV